MTARDGKVEWLSEWQPIETAPKDGTKLLLFVVQEPDDYCRAVGLPEGWSAIEVGEYSWHCSGHEHGWEHPTAGSPTHWMPLPQPPHNHPSPISAEHVKEG